MTNLLLRASATPGAFAQNAPFFSPSFTPPIRADQQSNLILQLELQSSVIIEVTLDGTNWTSINSGVAVPAFSQFDIFASSTDQVNVRTPDGAGVTVTSARLILDQDA